MGQWPNLPYKVPVEHAPWEDFGDTTVTELGAAGDQRQAAAFDVFVAKLERQLTTYNERFTAINMAAGQQSAASFLLDLIPRDVEHIRSNYFSSLLRTLATMIDRFGLRSLLMKNQAPFSQSVLDLDIDPNGFYEWTPPVLIDVPVSDYIVQIKTFELNLDVVPYLSDWLIRCVNDS